MTCGLTMRVRQVAFLPAGRASNPEGSGHLNHKRFDIALVPDAPASLLRLANDLVEADR
jgi:hypothetical protein